MGDADEGIVLTDEEREMLAGLAESIADPWLAGQLAGQGHTQARPKRPPAWLRFAASGWAGLLMVLVGGALAVTTFIHSTAVASLGLAVMGVGLWRSVAEHGAGVMHLLTVRRTPGVGPTGRATGGPSRRGRVGGPAADAGCARRAGPAVTRGGRPAAQ